MSMIFSFDSDRDTALFLAVTKYNWRTTSPEVLSIRKRDEHRNGIREAS